MKRLASRLTWWPTRPPTRAPQAVIAAGSGAALEGPKAPVQSGWGIDAQRMQGALDDILGAKTEVPQGGVIWVFAVKR